MALSLGHWWSSCERDYSCFAHYVFSGCAMPDTTVVQWSFVAWEKCMSWKILEYRKRRWADWS